MTFRYLPLRFAILPPYITRSTSDLSIAQINREILKAWWERQYTTFDLNIVVIFLELWIAGMPIRPYAGKEPHLEAHV